MLKVAVIGGSGYTGVELLRILANHPQVEVVAVTSREQAGQTVTACFPALAGRPGGLDDLVFELPDVAALTAKAEFFFTAVPHKSAMEMVPGLLAGGGRVVDLSADFRFRDPEVYNQWYEPHQATDLLAEAVYGLPELHREEIKTARLVGNPGCYPTTVILAMAPLVKHGLIDPDMIIADSKSGVSGAGRGLSLTSHFCEVHGGFSAYKVVGHRHTPEIEQELSLLAGRPLKISFTPHLVPMSRGILSTVYAPLKQSATDKTILELYREFYGGDKFIRIRPGGQSPQSLDVYGTNFCDLGVFVDQRVNRIKVISVIDNLTRGASGQAVCNMNLMMGFPEETGLTALGLRP